MTAAVLRYCRLAVAYALSAAVAGLLIGVLFAVAGEGVPDTPWYVLAAFAALFMAIWAALPAHAIVLVAEWRAIRSPWLYVGFAHAGGRGITGAVQLRLTPWMAVGRSGRRHRHRTDLLGRCRTFCRGPHCEGKGGHLSVAAAGGIGTGHGGSDVALRAVVPTLLQPPLFLFPKSKL